MKPERFGKYILLDKIAAGGMAEVYLAKSSGSEGVSKFLAIKRILPQFSANEEFIDMFKEEAKIAINIAHSNVVSINEFGEYKGQYFISMEYVQGRNLRQLINRLKKREQKIPIEHIVYMVHEISKGLDYAHRCIDKNTGRPLNIIHRDMSPQNIMISFEGEIKLVDFGIAKAESKLEHTKAGTLKGKFGYMSPEQAEGLDLDHRTDIFSLGIILWELLANDRLFVANNEINTIRKIRDCRIPELHKIDPEIHMDLENIVNKALARDRSLRYQTSSELQRDLSRFLNRHYPDYTSQDIAHFIKQSYTSEILEIRERLVAYSKVQMDFSTGEERTEILQDPTVTNTEKNDKLLGSTEDVRSPLNLPDLGKDTLKNIDFKSQVTSKSYSQNIPKNSMRYNQTGSFSSKYAKKSSGLSNTAIILFCIGLGLSAYIYLYEKERAQLLVNKIINGENANIEASNLASTNQASSNANNNEQNISGQATLTGSIQQETQNPQANNETQNIANANSTNTNSVPKQIPNIPMPPTELQNRALTYSFQIQSKPLGASIYINHQNTGFYTPGRILLQPNIPYTISLKKRGYIDYTKTITATENGQQFTATLQKEQTAYISVNVTPMNADIYINDEKLSEKPPLTKYAVPANKILKIRAYNPYSRTEDQKEISVKEDNHITIDLYLTKISDNKDSKKRKPAER